MKIQDTYQFKAHCLTLKLVKQRKAKYKNFVGHFIIISYVNFVKFFNL